MSILEILRNALSSGKNAILLHSNADLDCVGSAAALSRFYEIETIIAPEGVSHLGKRLMSLMDMDTIGEIEIEGIDHFFVVDAQDDSSLGYRGAPWKASFIIDHHRIKNSVPRTNAIIQEDANSTCEIIWDIMGRPDKVSREIGLCLMAGIISDTSHLKRGNYRTLRTASEILEASDIAMEDVMVIFETAEDQEMSRRISRMKGVQRMRFDRVGEWIVAASEIGAFESAVCHALISTGADVAFASSQNDDNFRITGRANQLAIAAGIHLGDMFNRISQECNGEGGGHDGAAGVSGIGDAEAILDVCMQNAISALKGRKRKSRNDEEKRIIVSCD